MGKPIHADPCGKDSTGANFWRLLSRIGVLFEYHESFNNTFDATVLVLDKIVCLHAFRTNQLVFLCSFVSFYTVFTCCQSLCCKRLWPIQDIAHEVYLCIGICWSFRAVSYADTTSRTPSLALHYGSSIYVPTPVEFLVVNGSEPSRPGA